MLCPSCGQQIPESSRFCGFCGAQLAGSSPASFAVNTRPPVKIGNVQFYFSGKVKLIPRRRWERKPDVMRDGLCVDFQILDDRGKPTAYDGIADLHLRVTQAALSPSALADTLFKTRASLCVKASEFQRDKDGQPFYHYEYAVPLRIKVRGFYGPRSEVGINLVPEGGREALYRQVERSADPEEQPNAVLRLQPMPGPIFIEKPAL